MLLYFFLIVRPLWVLVLNRVRSGLVGRFGEFFSFCSGSWYLGGCLLSWLRPIGHVSGLLSPFGGLLGVAGGLEGSPLIIIVINTHNLY